MIWIKRIGLLLIGVAVGYGIGVWQWRGMAAVESYAIGLKQGYEWGMSDALIPGAEIVSVSPDGKVINKRNNHW